jgi:hypothetical protein
MNALVPTCEACVTAYRQAPVWRKDEPHLKPSCITHWSCRQRGHGLCESVAAHRAKSNSEDSVFVATAKVMLASLPDAFALAKQANTDREVGQMRLDIHAAVA